MRKLAFSVTTVLALVILGMAPAPARASWLSQALHGYFGPGGLDTYYYGPGYGYYPPGYSYYYAPGYEVMPGYTTYSYLGWQPYYYGPVAGRPEHWHGWRAWHGYHHRHR